MYKVDFDSFFIQLQCPFLNHASVETYLISYLGNSPILTIVNSGKPLVFGPSVQVSFSWSAQSQMDKTLCLKFLNTAVLVTGTMTVAKSSASHSTQVASPSPHPPLQNLLPLSISQHCMSGARFQNPHNEKVNFTDLIFCCCF